MVEAFKAANLDPKDPAHVEILLQVLASAVFGQSSAGKKKGDIRWTPDKEFQLFIDKLKVDHAAGKELSDAQVAKRLKQDPAYQYDTVSAIRKRLPAARYTFDWSMQGVSLWALNLKYGPKAGS